MRVQQFIDALQSLEQQGDVDRIASLFADNAEMTNPHLHEPMRGSEGARRFWSEYRDAFGDIRSSFKATIESENTSVLEWVSDGTMRANGKPFCYGGVTILEWSGDRVSRFATYFDTQPLRVEPMLGVSDTASPGLPEDPRSW